ncbi:nuclease domain-containing protein [Paraburkholderia sp.]|uniref:nuclease domain-containing protein n=1 Tax=Paraburkholderia sp. TaxID=1926495 RepID=UPI0025E9A882|nr:nuclease domain-containing protein [Paraburkholderia sp.]
MKRSGFARKASSSFSSFANRATVLRRKAMKRRVNKPTVADGAKYLAACRGEPCYLRVPGVCLHSTATVVPCHSNQSRHGKGMGIKAKHEYTVPGCASCHQWIDQGPATRAAKFAVWDQGYEQWFPVRAEKMRVD